MGYLLGEICRRVVDARSDYCRDADVVEKAWRSVYGGLAGLLGCGRPVVSLSAGLYAILMAEEHAPPGACEGMGMVIVEDESALMPITVRLHNGHESGFGMPREYVGSRQRPFVHGLQWFRTKPVAS